MDRVLARFADPAGGFFDTADDHERLVTRPKDVQDNAVPSGNAMAARVLLRLAAWTGDGAYRGAAERAMRTVVPFVGALPDRLRPVARRDGPRAGAGRRGRDRGRARTTPRPRRSSPRPGPASARTRSSRSRPTARRAPCRCSTTDRAIGGRPSAYVCRGFACRLPVTDPEALRAELAAAIADG